MWREKKSNMDKNSSNGSTKCSAKRYGAITAQEMMTRRYIEEKRLALLCCFSGPPATRGRPAGLHGLYFWPPKKGRCRTRLLYSSLRFWIYPRFITMEDSNINLNFTIEATATEVTMTSSPNDTTQADFKMLEKMVAIVVPVFFTIVCLIGFLGNNLVILVVTFNKQMRNTTNLLILNLAVADVLFIVCCVPFTATSYALPHNWPFGDVWCRMVQYLIYSLALVSIYTLVLMSLDRFLAVVYALESMTWRTEENCKIAIAVTWIICAFFCIPLIFSHGEIVPAEGVSYCGFMNNQTIPFLPEDWDMRWNSAAFTIAFFNGGYVFPLLLICGMYSVMLRRLWRQAPGGHASAESIRNKKRVIRMVLIVIVIFALSWLPIQVVLVLRSLGIYPTSPFSVSIQIFSQLLAYGNSCVNPILYAFLSEPFRRGFCAVVSCMKPAGPHGLHGSDERASPGQGRLATQATIATQGCNGRTLSVLK